MSLKTIKYRGEYLPFAAFMIAMAAVITVFIVLYDGTCDSGDSIMHYLFARYAFIHPENLFDPWAKPLFTLLAAPFAQFGFTGIKVFNGIVALLTAGCLFGIAKRCGQSPAWITAFFLFFSPLYFSHIFSGLTEALFGLVLAMSIYYILRDKTIAALIVISFLPFVRSEGFVIEMVFAFWLIWRRKYRFLPLLMCGTLLYSIAGYFVHHDIFWVFSQNPYVGPEMDYGSGTWSHFITQTVYVLGIPIYILAAAGLLYYLLAVFMKPLRHKYFADAFILVAGSFIAYLLMHTIFWRFGMYHSMGLKRVINAVVPMAALLALSGLRLLSLHPFVKKKWISSLITVMFCLYAAVFPFTSNPAAVHWNTEFDNEAGRVVISDAAGWIHDKYDYGKEPLCVYAHPAIGFELDQDPFDTSKHLHFTSLDSLLQEKIDFIVIWDNWFALAEEGVSYEGLSATPKLKQIAAFGDTLEKSCRIVIFSSENE